MKYTSHETGLKLFGQRLREIRLSKNISQEKLAADCNIEVSQISRIERGILNTGVANIFIIAEALEVHPKELFEFEI